MEYWFKLLFITFPGKIVSKLSFCSISKNEAKILMHIVRRFNASFLRKNIFCQKTVIAIVIIKNIFIDEGLKNPEMTD